MTDYNLESKKLIFKRDLDIFPIITRAMQMFHFEKYISHISTYQCIQVDINDVSEPL